MQIKEFKKGKTKFLFDTGAVVTLVKLWNLRGEMLIYEDKMTLAGITEYEITVIGKITTIILLNERQIQYPMYVIPDDFPIDYEDILVDFLRKHLAITATSF